MTKALRSGNHGPRVRTPAGRTWASSSESRTSRRPESSSQPRDPDPAPYLGRSPEPSQAPVGAAADPRVRCRHVSHRADLRTSAPCLGRGPEPPRAPVGAAADPRVWRRHVSHRADLRTSAPRLGQGSGAATSPCGRGCRPLGPVPPHVPQSRVFCLKSALLPH